MLLSISDISLTPPLGITKEQNLILSRMELGLKESQEGRGYLTLSLTHREELRCKVRERD